MSETIVPSPPSSLNTLQRYQVLVSNEEDEEEEDIGDSLQCSDLVAELVSNASMQSTESLDLESLTMTMPENDHPSSSTASLPRSVSDRALDNRRSTMTAPPTLPQSPKHSIVANQVGSHNNHEVDDIIIIDNDRNDNSRHSFKLHDEWKNNHDDDDNDLSDDEDDEQIAGLRRYHFAPAAAALPVEFDHSPPLSWKRFTSYLCGLRLAARQRRAHRLLSMSAVVRMDSPYQQASLCWMMYCWDATDRGILLFIILIFGWLVVGFVFRRGAHYWYIGMALCSVRFAARPLYETIRSLCGSVTGVGVYSRSYSSSTSSSRGRAGSMSRMMTRSNHPLQGTTGTSFELGNNNDYSHQYQLRSISSKSTAKQEQNPSPASPSGGIT